MSTELTRIHIGPYAAGDEDEILRVFCKVFQVERSKPTWTWQYANNPAGLHCYLAKFDSGQVVSQFTGVPRRVKVRDRVLCFSEIVDSFTDPEYRQGLKKPGWFAMTCHAFVDHYGRPDREVIMYGLPNPPAYRVGSRLLGYVHFHKVELLTRDLSDTEPAADQPIEAGARAETVARFGDEATALFERLSKRHEVMTVRDAGYLNWRYPDRPDAEYELIQFRDGAGELYGFAVLRHAWLDNPVTVACEILADPDHVAIPSTIRHLEARARHAGSDKLQAMLRPDSPEWQGLVALGFFPERSQFRLVARSYDRINVPLDWLQENWYVTLGDFDIV